MQDWGLTVSIGMGILVSGVAWMWVRREEPKPRRKRHKMSHASQQWKGVNWDVWTPPQRRRSRKQPQGTQTLLFLPTNSE